MSHTIEPKKKKGLKTSQIAAILLGFFILLTAVFMIYYFSEYKEAPKRLGTWGPNKTIDTFTFINQDGKIITNEDVKGKVCVVEYFFTTCKGICPKMNENLARVYQAYRGNSKVMFLSHTVDPEADTVEALKAYSLRYDADPKQWMFLTGSKQRLYDMAYYSYKVTAVDSTRPTDIESDFIHDQHFVLVDQNGYLRGNGGYDGLQKRQVDSLIDDIRVLLNEK